jgi:DNA-binding transcriptional MerR regulator
VRLSLKALRVYDEMGLLKPAVVDPRSGYRYYRADQLEPARLIGLLRQLDMPLARINEVISLRGAEAAKAIATYWVEVETDLRTKRKLVRYLQSYLTRKGEPMFGVETREVAQQEVASKERRLLVDELPSFINEAVGSLVDLIESAGGQPGVPLVIYHGEVNKDADGPVEVCVPFVGDVKPAGDARVRIEAGHREAFTRLTKSQVAFPGILEAYEAVDRWVESSNMKVAGSPREVYFADWETIGPDDPACDVAFPVSD